jgi:2,4-dienoyl-CoA reductase-like NADH-dependent reductase (Old Yellow Enzyme family)
MEISNRSVAPLFKPFTLKDLTLSNRIVMAPMTRAKSPGGVPGPDVAAYYRRRAEGGVGLLVTEGTFVGHVAAGFDPNIPRFYRDDALAGWKRVAAEVHAAGGRIMPQLWHVGAVHGQHEKSLEGAPPMSPSGLFKPGHPDGVAMTQADIDAAVKGFGDSAQAAIELGFDGVELHGAHGYLIDQFFWEGTNQRTDGYGGSIQARTRFGAEIVREVRRRIGPDFPLILRIAQWKLQDYTARLAQTPQELEQFLKPLVDAGVDIFHCSQRRFWEPEFPGSTLNLAGWTKKLTGKPTITVGSVTLSEEFMTTFQSDQPATVTGIDELLDRLDRGEFDLVAIGRALLSNPDWPRQVQNGGLAGLKAFRKEELAQLT